MQDLKFKVFYEPSGKIYDVLAMDFIKKNVTVEYKKGKTQVVGMIFCHIMQYTGLKDINGVEIYEGDVIEFLTYDGEIFRAHVVFERLAFKALDTEDECYDYDFDSLIDIEVIGNIYKTPDLLD